VLTQLRWFGRLGADDLLDVYLDTNILIAYILGQEKEPENFRKAKKVFDDIKSGRYRGVITYLVLQEALSALRRIFAGEYEYLKHLSRTRQQEYVKGKSSEHYENLLKKLLELHEAVTFEKCKNVNTEEILQAGLEVLQRCFGVVRVFRHCNVCKSTREHSTHKGLGPIDVIHIFAAKQLGYKDFATLDKGFNLVKSDQHFSDMNIFVL